jgi:hypothetical protein
MAIAIRRPLRRTWPIGHAAPWIVPTSGLRQILGGGLTMAPLGCGGPAGPVGPFPGTDRGYQGMDPSDPATYVRPYRPQPGMIAYLNYDGAMPNRTQTV